MFENNVNEKMEKEWNKLWCHSLRSSCRTYRQERGGSSALRTNQTHMHEERRHDCNVCVCVWVLWRFASRNGCVRTFYTSVVSPNSGGHAGKLTSSPHIYFQHRIFSQNAIRCRCLILTGKVSCVFSAGFHRGSPLPVPKVELRQREMLFRSL